MHASLVLLDTTSETPEGVRARAVIAAEHIGRYSPAEPVKGGAAVPEEDAKGPAAGGKRKGGAGASSAAAGAKTAKAGASKKR